MITNKINTYNSVGIKHFKQKDIVSRIHLKKQCNYDFIQKYSKTCVKRPLSKTPKIGLQDQLLLNVGQKYCRMLHGEHSAVLLTFIKLPFVIKFVVLSIFEWPFYTVFTVRRTLSCDYLTL